MDVPFLISPSRRSGLAGGGVAAPGQLGVPLLEALYPATGVHKFLFAGEERMAGARNLDLGQWVGFSVFPLNGFGCLDGGASQEKKNPTRCPGTQPIDTGGGFLTSRLPTFSQILLSIGLGAKGGRLNTQPTPRSNYATALTTAIRLVPPVRLVSCLGDFEEKLGVRLRRFQLVDQQLQGCSGLESQ